MLLPALLGYAVFFLYPALANFYYSLTDWSHFRPGARWVGLDQYRRLAGDEQIWLGVRNSLLFAAVTTLFQSVLSVPLALALDRKLRTVSLLRLTFVAPSVLSSLVIGYLWMFLMSPTEYGALNRLLHVFGLEKINWLGDPGWALYSVALTQIWQWTGWTMLIVLANLQSIPKDLYEAADLDGAGPLRRFWNVTLPQLYPSISMNAVLTMISGLKVFDIIFAMTKGGPGHATESMTTLIMARGFGEGMYGYASAYSVLFFGLIAAVTAILLGIFRKWRTSVS